jgi:CheY-like chemotaxis protein
MTRSSATAGEVLAWIRKHPHLKSLPVVVLTSSAEDRDRQKAEQLGAQAYLVRPPDAEMLQQTMQALEARAPLAVASA